MNVVHFADMETEIAVSGKGSSAAEIYRLAVDEESDLGWTDLNPDQVLYGFGFPFERKNGGIGRPGHEFPCRRSLPGPDGKLTVASNLKRAVCHFVRI